MITSINAGFGAALSVDDVTQMHAMRFGGCRTDLPPGASYNIAVGILSAFVHAPLSPLILLHGEAMDGPTLVEQALRTARQATVLGLAIDLELANEPDLTDVGPLEMAKRCAMTTRALREDGFTGRIYGGSVSNLNTRGIGYLKAMQWATLPPELLVAVHRYAPRNDPKASHLASLQHEVVAAIEATDRRPPPAITEMGYHTAKQTASWSLRPPFYRHGFRLTNEDVADALFHDLPLYASWGCPRVDVFQWNCGHPASDTDYEALYGVRDVNGHWLPQGIMLAQMGPL